MNMASLISASLFHASTVKGFWSRRGNKHFQRSTVHPRARLSLKNGSKSCLKTRAIVQKGAEEERLPDGSVTEMRSYTASHKTGTEGIDIAVNQLLPAIAGFCQHRWLVLVAPPSVPRVAALSIAGINPSRVLLVHPNTTDGLATIERALRSGTCGAVLAWLESNDGRTIDRLRIAAETGHAWGIMFRAVKDSDSSAPPVEIVNKGVSSPRLIPAQMEMGIV